MFSVVSNTAFTALILTIFTLTVESQMINLDLLHKFKYKCGVDSCNILTQFCDDDDGPSHCEYCTEDVCNSDREDYPGCSLACDYQSRQKPVAIPPTGSTIRHTSEYRSAEYATQTPAVIREIPTCTPLSDFNAFIGSPLAIGLSVLLGCSLCANILSCMCYLRRKRKSKNTKDKEKRQIDIDCIDTERDIFMPPQHMLRQAKKTKLAKAETGIVTISDGNLHYKTTIKGGAAPQQNGHALADEIPKRDTNYETGNIKDNCATFQPNQQSTGGEECEVTMVKKTVDNNLQNMSNVISIPQGALSGGNGNPKVVPSGS